MTEHQQTDLLRDIRNLLAEREQSYQKYLADSKAEYDRHVQEVGAARQTTAGQIGAVSIWLFLVVFAANVAAGLAAKLLTYIDVLSIDIM